MLSAKLDFIWKHEAEDGENGDKEKLEGPERDPLGCCLYSGVFGLLILIWRV